MGGSKDPMGNIPILFRAFLVFLALACPASASTLQIIDIGFQNEEKVFQKHGYGILIRFKDRCLVVTPAHVARLSDDDPDYEWVTARWDDDVGALLEEEKHNGDLDVYVGTVPKISSLYAKCTSAPQIQSLYNEFLDQLRSKSTEDFSSLELQIGSGVTSMLPDSKRTLGEIQHNEPLLYFLKDCPDCNLPFDGASGSPIWLREPDGEKLFLGLHQGICGDACTNRNRTTWRAITIYRIYELVSSWMPAPGLNTLREERLQTPIIPDRKLNTVDLIRAVQTQLSRLNCEPGDTDGRWGVKSKDSLTRFSKAYELPVAGRGPSADLLGILESAEPKTCPSHCSVGETLDNGTCVTVQKPVRLFHTPKQRSKPKAKAQRPQSEVRNDNKCRVLNGKTLCQN